MTVDGFADDAAEVGRDCQVATFVELGLIESRPLAVYFTALHRTAHYEHHVGVTVVGAAVTVFAGGAAEFRHGDNHGVLGEIAKVNPEGGERLRKIAQDICDLPLRAAFVNVMVPSTDIGECNLHA